MCVCLCTCARLCVGNWFLSASTVGASIEETSCGRSGPTFCFVFSLLSSDSPTRQPAKQVPTLGFAVPLTLRYILPLPTASHFLRACFCTTDADCTPTSIPSPESSDPLTLDFFAVYLVVSTLCLFLRISYHNNVCVRNKYFKKFNASPQY